MAAIGLALAIWIAPAPAHAAKWDVGDPIACATSKYPFDRDICDHPDVMDSYEKVRHAYLRTRAKFTGTDLKIFHAGQTYWLFDLGGDCFSLDPNGNYRSASWELQCIKDGLAQRLEFLRALQSNPASLKSTVAIYGFIEPWYLKMFAGNYEGKSVQLEGTIDLGGCKDESAKVPHPAARIVGNDGVSIPIHFKSMPANDIWLLCERHPSDAWAGKVILDRAGPFLYSTEILGV